MIYAMTAKVIKECPFCDYQYGNIPRSKKYWGCPVLTCKRCGKYFIDHDIIEPAFFMMPFAWLPRVRLKNLLLYICSIGFMIEGFINVNGGNEYIALSLAVSAALLFNIAFQDMFIEYRNGKKSFTLFLKEIKESRDRLENSVYVNLLIDSGYRVPSKYMQSSSENRRSTLQ